MFCNATRCFCFVLIGILSISSSSLAQSTLETTCWVTKVTYDVIPNPDTAGPLFEDIAEFRVSYQLEEADEDLSSAYVGDVFHVVNSADKDRRFEVELGGDTMELSLAAPSIRVLAPRFRRDRWQVCSYDSRLVLHRERELGPNHRLFYNTQLAYSGMGSLQRSTSRGFDCESNTVPTNSTFMTSLSYAPITSDETKGENLQVNCLNRFERSFRPAFRKQQGNDAFLP